MLRAKYWIKTVDGSDIYVGDMDTTYVQAIQIACRTRDLKRNEIVSCKQTYYFRMVKKLVKIGKKIITASYFVLHRNEVGNTLRIIAEQKYDINVLVYHDEFIDALDFLEENGLIYRNAGEHYSDL